MKFVEMQERPDWKSQAEEAGFTFHTMHGEAYWAEDGAYSFTLEEIERDLEDPATELHGMCRQAVSEVLSSDGLLDRFAIPHEHRDLVRQSWIDRQPEVYGRFDFIYGCAGRPAKMIEYNADTPTSLYESAVIEEHQASAPRYDAVDVCEEQHGAGNCQAAEGAGGGSFFMPLLAGYMIGNMMRNNSAGSYRARPLVSGSSGGYLTTDGRTRLGSLGGTTKVTSRALTTTPATTIGKPAMSRATVSARGGFRGASTGGSFRGG